jgi:carboxymethylenebutenolidase
MCYDLDSRPPLPPIRGAAGDAGPLTLTSADGVTFAAYGARAERDGGPGIVVLPDVRGLHPFFEELALRFAEAGVHAVAIDYFARTAETPDRGEGFDYQSHVAQCRPESLSADIAAAAAYLRSPEGGNVDRLYTVGFCFGGKLSLLQATTGISADGVISFYGWPVGTHRTGIPAPIDVVDRFAAPVLSFWGGADQGISAEDVKAFADALAAAGVQQTSITYPDAPHSFFDRKAAEFSGESDDAWRQMLAFMGVTGAA